MQTKHECDIYNLLNLALDRVTMVERLYDADLHAVDWWEGQWALAMPDQSYKTNFAIIQLP